MKILISNDDGIFAPGLHALVEACRNFGDITVVAPDRERSGAGHSLTLHRPVRIYEREPKYFSVDGTPTDCINLGVLELLKDAKPDLVVSGINHGANLGDDVTYSGTVSAALEARLLGIPSIAVSLATSKGEKENFKPAIHFVRKLLGKLDTDGVPNDLFLNINVPNVMGASEFNYQFTRLGSRRYAGATIEKLDPRGKKYYWIGGDELDFEDKDGSDSNAIRLGEISVTPIRVDMTDDNLLTKIKSWDLDS